MSNYIKAMDVDNDPICEIKEETKHAPHIEDFKPAEEIERLQNINADLLEACKDAYNLIALTRPDTCGYVLIKLSDAIAKSEGRG
jgi:hypothetical protein